jgi:hypothetical protein
MKATQLQKLHDEGDLLGHIENNHNANEIESILNIAYDKFDCDYIGKLEDINIDDVLLNSYKIFLGMEIEL